MKTTLGQAKMRIGPSLLVLALVSGPALDAAKPAAATASLASRDVDLTMPGRAQWPGTLHPVTGVVDELVEGLGAEMALRHPADRLNVAQSAGARLDVGFEVVGGIVVAAVAGLHWTARRRLEPLHKASALMWTPTWPRRWESISCRRIKYLSPVLYHHSSGASSFSYRL